MRPRALVVLGILMLGGCTHLPWNPHRGWRALKTPHFTLYTDTLSEYQPALEWLESAHRVYESTFFRGQQMPPIDVLYMAAESRTPFLTFGGQYKYGVTLAHFKWAEAHGGRGLLMVGNYSWQWSYQHQLAHHFIEAAVPRAPLWFQEGLARYLAGVSPVVGRPGVYCFGKEHPSTKVTLPLKELLAATYQAYNQESEPWIGPLSHSFVDYLIHGEGGRLRAGLGGLMQALASGKSSEEALAAVYPGFSLERMDVAYRNHIRSMRPLGQECALSASIEADGVRAKPIESPMAESDIQALFEGLDQIAGRDGYADFFPDAEPAAKAAAH